MGEHGPVREIADQLGRIFRHLLPGVLILAAARVSHPHWFVEGLDWGKPSHLALMAVIATMVGNTWYVAHRYTFHQLLDVLLYALRRKSRPVQGYTDWLAKHVHDTNLFPPHADDLRQHTLFRSAQVIYLFILGEVFLFFAWRPAPKTLFERERTALLWGGAIVLAFAFWQYWLTYWIDLYAAKELGGKRRGVQHDNESDLTSPRPGRN